MVTIIFSLNGCSDSNPLGRLKIEGEVTLDGKPVNGNIEFEPTGNQQDKVQSGSLVVNGKYSISASKGLVEGEYIVRIVATEEVAGSRKIDPNTNEETAEYVDVIPPDYGAATKQKITVEKGKKNQFNFNMENKK
ncbi:MAG: hypothetical protein LBH59_01615 [Planctomycetaceae bacterium]|nr:hypothetical protein [Planctomycetaceae bacterium]